MRGVIVNWRSGNNTSSEIEKFVNLAQLVHVEFAREIELGLKVFSHDRRTGANRNNAHTTNNRFSILRQIATRQFLAHGNNLQLF